jgi:hypothetical protein
MARSKRIVIRGRQRDELDPDSLAQVLIMLGRELGPKQPEETADASDDSDEVPS